MMDDVTMDNSAASSTSTSATTAVTPFTNNNNHLLPTSSNTVTTQEISDLIAGFRDNDSAVRLRSFQSLAKIANALGAERTRTEFLPYLYELMDDEDEILLTFAEQLATLIEPVGGPEYAHTLLPHLEHLASTEESTVRDKCAASVEAIAKSVNDAHIELHVLPFVRRLASAEWFTSKITACSLIPVIYPRVNPSQKKELRSFFNRLCSDEIPMIRRAACAHLGSMGAKVGELDKVALRDELFPALKKLTKDDQDSVRLMTVPACVQIGPVLRSADHVTLLSPLLFGLCQDKSWRVRYMVADRFCDLTRSMGECKSDDWVDAFVGLLSDEEAEVRTAAAAKVGELSKLVGAGQTVKKLVPPLKQLVRDTNQYVRAALGAVIMSMAGVIPKRDTYDHLVPLFLILLKDSVSEVRLNIISKLETINQVMSADMLSQSLLPAIADLAQDTKWRVRLQIIENIPTLAQQLGHEFFDSKLLDMCMQWLGDQVYSIREAATANLIKIAKVYGVPWTTIHIIPQLVNLGNHRSYIYRMTAVFAIRDLAPIIGPQLTVDKCVPVLNKLCVDPVPNVKFNCVKSIMQLVQRDQLGARAGANSIYPSLAQLISSLVDDPDSDVKYYAQLCLHELSVASSSAPTAAVANALVAAAVAS